MAMRGNPRWEDPPAAHRMAGSAVGGNRLLGPSRRGPARRFARRCQKERGQSGSRGWRRRSACRSEAKGPSGGQQE
eukprot:6441713-Alexandrium_andersonii.AAC.1